MSVKTADRSLNHLYPPFRVKLAQVLKETEQALGEQWVMTEGYRSQERQTFLWNRGRSTPGPKVTWIRTPLHHGAGLAADCMPKSRGYEAPRLWWETYLRIGKSHGLDNPAFVKGDLGHLQLSDPVLRARALVWVRAGFRDPPVVPPPADGISVLVEGQPVPDASAFLEDGRAWVMLRPVADGLDFVIAEVRGKSAKREALLVDDEMDALVDVVLRDGRAFARAFDLPALVYWLAREKIVTIARKPKP